MVFIFIMFAKTKRIVSDFIWEFGMLPFHSHLGIFFNDFGKKSPKYTKLENTDHFLIGNDSLIRW